MIALRDHQRQSNPPIATNLQYRFIVDLALMIAEEMHEALGSFASSMAKRELSVAKVCI